MAEGSDLHPLQQLIPHPWRTDNGKAQLRAPGMKKGGLLKLLLMRPLGLLPLLLGIGCKAEQTMSNLLRKALGILASRS
jgi:hypothetical protein